MHGNISYSAVQKYALQSVCVVGGVQGRLSLGSAAAEPPVQDPWCAVTVKALRSPAGETPSSL